MEDLGNGITRELDEDDIRWYSQGGHRYVSVTAVLDNWVPKQLKNWFKNTSAAKIEKTRSETAQKGSDLHTLAAEGKEDRFNDLIKSLEMTLIDHETVVCSKRGWAGQRDYKARLNGKLYVVDVKSGRFGQAAAQLGAYSLAANENGENIEGIGVISLPRDGSKAQWFDYSKNLENCQYAWTCLFDYWKFTNYKKLLEWEFFNNRTVLDYNWAPKGE